MVRANITNKTNNVISSIHRSLRRLASRRLFLLFQNRALFSVLITSMVICIVFALVSFPERKEIPSKIIRSEITPDLKNAWKERVTVGVVGCGSRLEEAITAIKSAVIFTPSHIHLIIIAFGDEDNYTLLAEKIEELRVEAQIAGLSFDYEVHPAWFPQEKHNEWQEMFKPCSTQRLFFPSLLPHVDSLIYLDSDSVLMSNVEDFWAHFKKMNKSQIAAMAPEHELPGDGWYNLHARMPYYGERGLNAGILLMNLTRMREVNLEYYMSDYYEVYSKGIDWADQDLLNIFFHFFPDTMYLLPCDFNYRIQHCKCDYKGDCSCKVAENEGISVYHGSRGNFHRSFEFSQNIYRAFSKYKLNENKPRDLLIQLERDFNHIQSKKEDCTQLNVKNIFAKVQSFINKYSTGQ